jgi:hypothetical protein
LTVSLSFSILQREPRILEPKKAFPEIDIAQTKADLLNSIDIIKEAIDNVLNLKPWQLEDIILRFVFDYSLSNLILEMKKLKTTCAMPCMFCGAGTKQQLGRSKKKLPDC